MYFTRSSIEVGPSKKMILCLILINFIGLFLKFDQFRTIRFGVGADPRGLCALIF